MKVKVTTDFTHKGTQKRSVAGEVLEVSAERAAELLARGVVEEVEKVDVVEQKEKAAPTHTPKKRK